MTFPTVNFTLQGYSWEFDPAYIRSEYSSGNTRQRKLMRKNNDIFTCRHVFTDAQTLVMENYINTTLDRGSLTDTMPYYASDVELTGTGQIVEGNYNIASIHKNLWEFIYNMEIIDRDLTTEEGVYNLINGVSGFEAAYNLFDALEDMVNYNNL